MEQSVKNIELIDTFIENERRSKMWTTISVVIFCLLGGVVYFLSRELNKSNAKYVDENRKLVATQIKLDSTLKLLADKNVSLQGDSATLSNQVVIADGKSDSLQKFCDTLTALFNTQSHLNDNFEFDPDKKLIELSQKTFLNKNVILSANLKKIVLSPVQWNKEENPVYAISFKCMPGLEKIAFSAGEKLKDKQFQKKKYAITGIETIEKFTFNPTVKYFKDEDESMAKSIAAQINNSEIQFFKDNPITIQKLSVKAPLSQIEIWIGRYERKKLDQLIMESSKYKILSEK
jgi:hypothetical protein